jgi:hypothetical protein
VTGERHSSLAVVCVICRSPATLVYGPDGRYRLHRWNCPHCTHRNEIMMAGKIVRVTKRHSAS